MSIQFYSLQYTMYKAENAQMFQNQYLAADRVAKDVAAEREKHITEDRQRMAQNLEGETDKVQQDGRNAPPQYYGRGGKKKKKEEEDKKRVNLPGEGGIIDIMA